MALVRRTNALTYAQGTGRLPDARFRRLKLNSMRFEIEAEMYTSCVLEHLEIAQIPIRYSKRLGEAKLGSVKDGWNILRKLLVRRIFKTPPHSVEGEGNLSIEQ